MLNEDAVYAIEKLANAMNSNLQSPNVLDSNMEPANIVDVLDQISRNLNRIADAISILAAKK